MDINKKPSLLSDKALLYDFMLAHRFWKSHYSEGKIVKKISKEELVNYTALIVQEMLKRKLSIHEYDDDLTTKVRQLISIGLSESKAITFMRDLPDEVKLIDDFAIMVGSTVEDKTNPNDIDIIIKYTLPEVTLLFDNIETEIPIQVSKSDYATGQSVPLYELVLRKKEEYHKKGYSYQSPIGQPITPQHYDSEDEFLILPDEGYYVEPFIHGIQMYLHRDQDEIYAIDGHGISYDLPELFDEARSIEYPEQFILDGVLNSRGEFWIVDMLRHSTTEIVGLTLKSRKNFINKLIIPPSVYLHKIPSFYLDIYEDPTEIVDVLSKISMSNDIVMRDSRDKYYINGTEPNWKFIYLKGPEKLTIGKQDFQPLKASTGADKYEFKLIDTTFEVWGKTALKESAIAVEEKFDGGRCVIHKAKDGLTKIFTEDRKRDISDNFPNSVKEISEISGEFIIDSEMVVHDDEGNALPRQNIMKFIVGNQEKLESGDWRIDDRNVIFNVFDCIYFNGKDLHNEIWSKRQENLEIVIPKDTEYLHRVIPTIVKSEDKFKTVLEEIANLPGSEGCMMKRIDSIYELDGRTTAWSKYKPLLTVDVEIMNITVKERSPTQKKATDSYMYTCGYIRDDTIERIGITYSTSIKADVGDILRVNPIELIKGKDGILTWMFPKVEGISPQSAADTYETLVRFIE